MKRQTMLIEKKVRGTYLGRIQYNTLTLPPNVGNPIAHCRNVRGLGKSVVVFRLFEKLRYSDERSTKFESPKQD